MSKDASTKYYQNNHQRLQEKYRKKYQSPFWRKKKKKQQFGCELYENLPEDEKQRKVEYRKKYYKIWRNKNTSQIKSFNFIVQTQEIAFSDKYRKI